MKTTIIAISIILVSSIANAVCIDGHPSIKDEYAKSQRIIIGKIIDKKEMPESGKYYEGNNHTVQVQEIFKGNSINTIVIFSENSSGRFPMSVGETYVLFIYYELGRYQIDNCGNSGLLPEKQDTAKVLRQLKEDNDVLPACIHRLSDFKCFQQNFMRTYERDNKLFWQHWRHHESKAKACTSLRDTSQFLSLVQRCDGELAEAMYEFIEKLSISKVTCFLRAAEKLDDKILDHLIRYYVMTPLYHDPVETVPLIENELKKKNYPRFKKLYFELKKANR